MTFEDRLDVDLDQYLWMIRYKTAALLAASAEIGAIIATDNQERIRLYSAFGENLGMAFQIRDDILGAWGDPQVTGKSAATDIRSKKKALPAVYALNQPGDRPAARHLLDLYAKPGSLDEDDIEAVLDILSAVGAREYAEEMEQEYYHRALENLEQTGINSSAQAQLRELAASLLGRLA
jgi:geranylgeranyl diphosphate synthase type I